MGTIASAHPVTHAVEYVSDLMHLASCTLVVLLIMGSKLTKEPGIFHEHGSLLQTKGISKDRFPTELPPHSSFHLLLPEASS